MALFFLFTVAAFATSPCEKFHETLAEQQLKDEHKVLALVAQPAPAAPAKFDPEWRYLDLGGMILPIPGEPRSVTKDSLGGFVVSSDRFDAFVGADTMKSWPEPQKSFVKKHAIRSDFDFQKYLYGKGFAGCGDVKTTADAQAKGIFAVLKRVPGPFPVHRAALSAKASALWLHGQRADSLEKKWVTSLWLRKDAKSSHVAVLHFAEEKDQRQLHSYLPRVRERKYFAPGKEKKTE